MRNIFDSGANMHVLPWSLPLQIVACTFHSVAIVSTVFRLVYRWCMARFWWEDGWAVFALLLDALCLACVWLVAPVVSVRTMPHADRVAAWIIVIASPSLLWASRISILLSVVRVANPSQRLRRVAFLVTCSFLAMWAALIAQRIQICLTNACIISASVAVPQLITDVLSDALLVVLPIYLLQRTKIRYRHRIMVFSVFSATLLITVVAVFHSAVLFVAASTGIVVISHVKGATSLIVCNLLVIVSLLYRLWNRGSDPDATEDAISFTSVDLNWHTGLTESAVDKSTMTVMERSLVAATEVSMVTSHETRLGAGAVEDVEKGGASGASVID